MIQIRTTTTTTNDSNNTGTTTTTTTTTTNDNCCCRKLVEFHDMGGIKPIIVSDLTQQYSVRFIHRPILWILHLS